MFDFHDHNPLFVLVGIIVAQLFLYGRKVKERVKIAMSDVVADIMQFGVMFIVCMGFLTVAKTITGWNLNDPWQLVTVVIMFNMSFETWFARLRDVFNNKAGSAFDVLMGRKVAVDSEPVSSQRESNPNSHTRATSPEAVRLPLQSVYSPSEDPDHRMNEEIGKLDNVSNNGHNLEN